VTVADTSDIDPCPYCGDTSGVQKIANTPPKVRAWSCGECGTDWAITVVNPYPYLDRLIAAVELTAARSMLRRVIALADEAPMLTEVEMRARLADLASAARPGQKPARCCRG
jgi:ribosomal protein L37AE/L43A